MPDLRVRAVAAVLRENAILMVQHQHEERSYWTLPGGGVEQGETPTQAATRELFEETGLRAAAVVELYQSDEEICFLVELESTAQPQIGYDPELGPLDQMITAVAWKLLVELVEDIQVSRVIASLRCLRQGMEKISLSEKLAQIHEHWRPKVIATLNGQEVKLVSLNTEIERKFLVTGTDWQSASPTHYCQGYLNRDKHRTVRVRVAGEHGFLTVKGLTTGASRAEFEYAIPLDDAKALLALCEGPLVEKMRHIVEHAGLRWEVDAFLGDNDGLVVAEIELESEAQEIALPEWVGAEITGDARYYNANLSSLPYKQWTDTGQGQGRVRSAA